MQKDREAFKRKIYDLMTGVYGTDKYLTEDGTVVSNEFAEDSECSRLYDEVYDANVRLCERLGVTEDADIEKIINNLMKIAEILSLKMYDYGESFSEQ